MPRANRHYIPGYIWHITHRCHKKEFLLKFARDRRRWLGWLFEAKKRYGLSILNYTVTSNHIHLLVLDNGGPGTIARSIQLIAGRTGQEYNQRKKRKGAFWEDRYHATAVESDDHLTKCMVYIDMNMVRAGEVKDPKEWPFCGYNEIQKPKERYGIIDYRTLIALLHMRNIEELQESHMSWIAEELSSKSLNRESKWTESIAVGSEHFVGVTMEGLGIRARGRYTVGKNGTYELRESATSYLVNFDAKNDVVRPKNMYVWDGIV